MKTLEEFLSELRQKGIRIWVDGEALCYETSTQKLTPTLLHELKERKAELLVYLNNIKTATRSNLAPIVPISRNNALPLSFSQTRLWFFDQYAESHATYNIFRAFQLEGKLNRQALEQSVNDLIARHETLRTCFSSQDGIPVQIILPQVTLSIPLADLGEYSSSEQDSKVERFIHEESHQPFDLKIAPLLRVRLLRLRTTTYILLLTIHHIVADGWSMEVLSRELSHLYQAACLGIASSLPPLTVQYVDFAQWQRDSLQEGFLTSQLKYWKRQLGGSLTVLRLPTDYPRPGVQTYNGASVSLELSSGLSAALQTLSEQNKATLFMTLLAAFKILLHRYSGQEDIIVGTPIANRNRQEIEPLIGFFVNSLVLRTDLGGDPTFTDLLRRIRIVTLGAYDNQDLPFEKLVEELQPTRDFSRHPIFQVWFNMLNLEESKLELTDLRVRSFICNQKIYSKFDITLYVRIQSDKISLQWVYNTDLFGDQTIAEMSERFHQLLVGIVDAPDASISSFSLSNGSIDAQSSERCHLARPNIPFEEFLDSEIQQSIPARFQKQVEKYSDKLAIKTKNYQWTYRELNLEANRIAHKILQYVSQEHEKIALLFEHDAPMVAAILAVLKLGHAYVPLDPNYPRARGADILEDSLSILIVTNDKNWTQAQSWVGGSLPILNIDQITADQPTSELECQAFSDSVAYLLYTSGSTGQPKGVIQSHRNVLFFIKNYTNNLHISSEDRLTLLSSYGFDAAMIDIFAALLNGACLYPFDVSREGLISLSSWLQKNDISIYHSTPTLYRIFLDSLAEKVEFDQIRLVVLGGEAVVGKDVDMHRQYFSHNCILVNGLGCTEASFYLQNLIDKKTKVPTSSIPVGYPFGGVEILLLDGSRNVVDIFGEIAIRSPYISLGYWRKPELTSTVFLPDPAGGDRRIYLTGDLGRKRPDGSFEFVGRKDFQVKIRGIRVELGEIEAVLNQNPHVLNSVVVIREDALGEKCLIAYMIPVVTGSLPQVEILEFLRQRLPSYMLPSSVVVLDKFPLTPNGKIDRRALSNAELSLQAKEETPVAPRDKLELQLLRIWKRILKIQSISVRDSFFDLGGHSLLGVQLIAQIEKSFQVHLPLTYLFQFPTIEGLAKALREKQPVSSWYSIAPLQPSGSRPPLFCFQVLKFQKLSFYLGQDQPVYTLRYGMAEPPGKPVLLPSVEELAAHFIQEMQTVQPYGPYYLLGWSFGGLVAYEIAHQLIAQGQKVALLAVLDTHIEYRIPFVARVLLRCKQRLKRIYDLFRYALQLTPAEFWRRVKRKLKSNPYKSAKTDEYFPHGQSFQAHLVLDRAYARKPYSGKVTLFKAIDSIDRYEYSEPPEVGWKKLITGTLEIHPIPGSHGGILEEPNVQVLADKLQYCIDQALSE